jgi:hypothetical protein
MIGACQAPAATPTASPPTPAAAAAPPPTTSSRIETLNAATAAYAAGDTATAGGLYDRVLNTPPSSGETAEATSAINGFASFRALVALLANGEDERARTYLDALQQKDPSAPFTRLASQLWDQYGMVGGLRGACAQLQPQIASQAGPSLAALGALGVTADAATLCSPPGTR